MSPACFTAQPVKHLLQRSCVLARNLQPLHRGLSTLESCAGILFSRVQAAYRRKYYGSVRGRGVPHARKVSTVAVR